MILAVLDGACVIGHFAHRVLKVGLGLLDLGIRPAQLGVQFPQPAIQLGAVRIEIPETIERDRSIEVGL
jgi:hypothetical protein